MGEAWVPVIFAAVIVLGVVGGQIAHTLLKRILPLLEDLVRRQQERLPGGELNQLRAQVSELTDRTAQLEDACQQLGRLEEQVSFLQSLLEEGSRPDRLRAMSDPGE